MRIYTTHEGKLDALNERFTNHTADFFEQYGMRNVGYWVPTDPEKSGNTLIYILEHESREAAAKSWEGFVNDPDRKSTRLNSIHVASSFAVFCLYIIRKLSCYILI